MKLVPATRNHHLPVPTTSKSSHKSPIIITTVDDSLQKNKRFGGYVETNMMKRSPYNGRRSLSPYRGSNIHRQRAVQETNLSERSDFRKLENDFFVADQQLQQQYELNNKLCSRRGISQPVSPLFHNNSSNSSCNCHHSQFCMNANRGLNEWRQSQPFCPSNTRTELPYSPRFPQVHVQTPTKYCHGHEIPLPHNNRYPAENSISPLTYGRRKHSLPDDSIELPDSFYLDRRRSTVSIDSAISLSGQFNNRDSLSPLVYNNNNGEEDSKFSFLNKKSYVGSSDHLQSGDRNSLRCHNCLIESGNYLEK